MLSLLCASASHLKTRTQRSRAICTSVLPASKTPDNKQKSIILTPCTSTQRKFENEQRKGYRILISSCWTTNIRLFDFYRKRGLGPDQSHYNQSRLWSRLQTTPAQITRIMPKWIYTVLKFFSPFTIFEQLALKKQSCSENFHCIEYIFYHSGFLTTCACPENRVCPKIFHCIECIFYHSGFLSNFALALKNRVAHKFFTALNILSTFRSFEQFVLALKNKGCPEFTVLNIYFSSFRIFEQLALALKNRVALKFFTVLNVLFTFRIFNNFR